MDTQHLLDAQTAEEARQFAIDWQNWQAEQSLSYGELADSNARWHPACVNCANNMPG